MLCCAQGGEEVKQKEVETKEGGGDAGEEKKEGKGEAEGEKGAGRGGKRTERRGRNERGGGEGGGTACIIRTVCNNLMQVDEHAQWAYTA